MKLITKEILERFKSVGDQSEIEVPLFIAKFFNPIGLESWYASEYDPETKKCDVHFNEVNSSRITENNRISELQQSKSQLDINNGLEL